jgi:hypothetical protein
MAFVITWRYSGIRLMVVALALALWAALAPWSLAESDSMTRTVQGEVVTVNLQSTPPVIVLKVLLPSKQEMIVGAMIAPETTITHGKQTVGLDAIQPGQIVRLTYLKGEKGLAARSIQIK